MHVRNHQKLLDARETYNRIKDVSNLIQGLETVTIDSEEYITKAESAYEALSSEEQQAIQNYDLLIEAKKRYESLVRINRVEKAIEAAKEEIPKEYIKGIWQNILYAAPFPHDASRSTYGLKKSKARVTLLSI